MLSGRQGRSPPVAEVERSTEQPGHFYDAPETVRQLMPTIFEWGSIAQLMSRPA